MNSTVQTKVTISSTALIAPPLFSVQIQGATVGKAIELCVSSKRRHSLILMSGDFPPKNNYNSRALQ